MQHSAFGKELLIEGGIYYPYGNIPGSKYTFSSQAHNTVTINDLSQVVTPESRVLPTPWKPLDLPWYSSDQFDYGSGEYNDGYGQERIKVRHQRSVVFRKNRNYAVLFDRLILTSSEPYRSQILFHLNSEGDIIRDNNNVASTQNTGANLTIHPVSNKPMSLEVVKGKKQEPIQGFADRGRQWLPVPTLVYSSKHQGPQAFAWVLSPQRPHEEDQIDTITAVDLVTTAPSDAQALKITFKDGTSEIILCSGNYTGEKTFAGITTSAQAGVYKLVGQNVTERHEYSDVD